VSDSGAEGPIQVPEFDFADFESRKMSREEAEAFRTQRAENVAKFEEARRIREFEKLVEREKYLLWKGKKKQ
jgi:hypothetical protein